MDSGFIFNAEPPVFADKSGLGGEKEESRTCLILWTEQQLPGWEGLGEGLGVPVDGQGEQAVGGSLEFGVGHQAIDGLGMSGERGAED